MAIAVPQHERRGHEVRGEIDHLQAVKVEAQLFAGLQPPHGDDLHRQDQRARHVHRGNQPAAAVQHRLALREGQREMQEQRRLQQPCHHVRPVDDPVKVVELAGVVERVENERHQAEDVEVSTLGRGPASQQDVEADAEVDQRNQPQSDVERPVGGRQNQRRFNAGFPAVPASRWSSTRRRCDRAAAPGWRRC